MSILLTPQHCWPLAVKFDPPALLATGNERQPPLVPPCFGGHGSEIELLRIGDHGSESNPPISGHGNEI